MTIQPSPDSTAALVEELRRRIADLTERIERQEKRIQKKIKFMGAGPCEDMEILLGEMVSRRDAMQVRLNDLEAEPFEPARAQPNLRVVARAAPRDLRVINKGWHIELFQGGVRLKKAFKPALIDA